MKKQKGFALVLVLIFLGVGALVITPALQLLSTGLRSQGISERALANQYAGDSGVQDALGQLLNGLMNSMNLSNPYYAYDFTYGNFKFPITLQLPQIPLSTDYGSGNLHHFVFNAEPNWINPGDNGTNYTVRMQNQQFTLTSYEFTLPKGMTYVPNSTYFRGPDKQNEMAYDATIDFTLHRVKWINGSWQNMTVGCGLAPYLEVTANPSPPLPNTSYLVKTTKPDGSQHLLYLPYLVGTGNRVYIMSCRVTGTPWGVNYLTEAGFVSSVTRAGLTTAAVGVAMYNIEMTVAGVTYNVVVAYDTTTGTFKILSYEAV